MGIESSKLNDAWPSNINSDPRSVRLKALTDVPRSIFDFGGIIMPARVMRVVDGDTYVLAVIINDEPVSITCRGDGYNTAESRRYNGITEEEYKKGNMVKNYVKGILTDKIVSTSFGKSDKYGRMLASIKLDNGQTLKEHLIESGYAAAYDGSGEKRW
jgi:endonuclease YncB( thermonuclease family)